jgi:hypothetical protein
MILRASRPTNVGVFFDFRYHSGTTLAVYLPCVVGWGGYSRFRFHAAHFTLQILTPSDCFLYVIVIPCLLAHRCSPCFCVFEISTMNESPIFNSRQGYLVFRGEVGNGMSWSICIIGIPVSRRSMWPSVTLLEIHETDHPVDQ